MNPILLKPKGDSISEVIHLGKSVGVTKAREYYEDWFAPGWKAIQKGLKELKSIHPQGRLIVEGAGSPVEINLKHRDLTNLRLAQYINANCLLVADIERGGVFAQLIGTLALLSSSERKLIKGIIINRFRGDSSLFDTGREWIEKETGIPVLGVMPWLNELFPKEDSLDLIERAKEKKKSAEINIVAIRLSSISNFSDLDPLEAESTINIQWVLPGGLLGKPDAVIIPGSKETLKDLQELKASGLGDQIKDYAMSGGNVLGICGGLQILGESLEETYCGENLQAGKSSLKLEGLNLLPIKTIFKPKKSLINREVLALWPAKCQVEGFEIHHGISHLNNVKSNETKPFAEDPLLGWVISDPESGIICGTYLHGVFENGEWRRHWMNEIRQRKGLPLLGIREVNYRHERDEIINRLADSFAKNIDLSPVL